MLEGLENVALHVVDDDDLRTAVREIRRQVYCDELGWVPESRTWDDDDERSIIFVAGNGTGWCSTVRMMMPGAPFEMESHFNLSEWTTKKPCAEIGRLAVLPHERHSLMAVALFRALYRSALVNGIGCFCVAANPANRLYPSLGFTAIGDVIHYPHVNAPAVPYVLDLDEALTDWGRRRPRLLDYFLRPIEGIG